MAPLIPGINPGASGVTQVDATYRPCTPEALTSTQPSLPPVNLNPPSTGPTPPSLCQMTSRIRSYPSHMTSIKMTMPEINAFVKRNPLKVPALLKGETEYGHGCAEGQALTCHDCRPSLDHMTHGHWKRQCHVKSGHDLCQVTRALIDHGRVKL